MKHLLLAAAVLASTATASADAPAAEAHARAFHADVEVDPTAYILSGFSLHAGLGWKHVRLDLGVFAMDLPQMLHGNEGWDASFVGTGAKVQWFPFAEQRGLWIDASVGVARLEATLDETGNSERDTGVNIGIDAGYRFALPYNLYVTPWAGLSRDVTDTDIMLDGKRFTKSAWTPFAAVHIGYRFR